MTADSFARKSPALDISSALRFAHGPGLVIFPVAIAEGPHPIPSRTRKLSPLAPMVLHIFVWESRSLPEPYMSGRLIAGARLSLSSTLRGGCIRSLKTG